MKKLLASIIPLALAFTACTKKDEKAPPAPSSQTADSKVQVAVTENGFEPASVNVPAGKPVTIVFTRKTDKTCAKSVVLTMDDGKKLEKELPLDTPVEVATTFSKAGKLDYACGMDMVKGTIVVQ
ncbi:MAG TPA: cupredoxin domain-containing protein [Kofleriaceae bacterium]